MTPHLTVIDGGLNGLAARCRNQLAKIDQPISGQTNIAEQIAAPSGMLGPIPVHMVATILTLSYDSLDRIVTLGKAVGGVDEQRLQRCYGLAAHAIEKIDDVIDGRNFDDIKTLRIKELEEALQVIKESAEFLADAFEWEDEAPISFVRIENAAANALAKGRVK